MRKRIVAGLTSAVVGIAMSGPGLAQAHHRRHHHHHHHHHHCATWPFCAGPIHF